MLLVTRTMVAAGGGPSRSPTITRRSMQILGLLIGCILVKYPVTGWVLPGPTSGGSNICMSRRNSQKQRCEIVTLASSRKKDGTDLEATPSRTSTAAASYNLGLGKNKPKVAGADSSSEQEGESYNATSAVQNWLVPEGVVKPPVSQPPHSIRPLASSVATLKSANITAVTTRRMVAYVFSAVLRRVPMMCYVSLIYCFLCLQTGRCLPIAARRSLG